MEDHDDDHAAAAAVLASNSDDDDDDHDDHDHNHDHDHEDPESRPSLPSPSPLSHQQQHTSSHHPHPDSSVSTASSSSSSSSTPRPPPKRALKLRIGQFNLLNFHAANIPFYVHRTGLTPQQVEAKVAWTADQLRRMNASIVGFQEIFSLDPLREAARRAGYDMAKTTIAAPACDGSTPAVGLLSVFPVLEVESFARFPPEAVMDFAALLPRSPAAAAPGASAGGGGPHHQQPRSAAVPAPAAATVPVIQSFTRPVLRAVNRLPTGHRLVVFVAHLKSKRPLFPRGPASHDRSPHAHAVATAMSLTLRAAEAAALRCLLLDEIDGGARRHRRTDDGVADGDAVAVGGGSSSTSSNSSSVDASSTDRRRRRSGSAGKASAPPPPSPPQPPPRQARPRAAEPPRRGAGGGHTVPTIVLGDLNDGTHAVTTEIVSGTVPFKRLPFDEKEPQWRSLFYSTHDVQARTADRDINYTYIHNGRYECLDNILVSNDLVRSNPSHIGYVQWVQYFNDHLIDQTLQGRRRRRQPPDAPER
ncbi:hypothetical protein DFJ73DRAFT_523748 [Zopfochytrium polystomum]|nr:hypothetical protein DFJ73DRAFT_523748 [Zopfochytrium polystomum]